MAVHALECHPRRHVRELHWCPWLALHVVLYLTLLAAGFAAWDVSTGTTALPSLFRGAVVAAWYGPWIVVPLVAGLALLRALGDLRWYWFRLCALLLFALPTPLLRNEETAAVLSLGAVQALMALLIVQPRAPGIRAHENPAMDRHDW